MEKSKWFSVASICSQATGISTVLTWIVTSLGRMVSACAAVPADEFPSSNAQNEERFASHLELPDAVFGFNPGQLLSV
jgi:hypothetical protein